jgi:uncharacterized membrane protein YphA (DoxX/SURF4 family)
MLAAVFITSGIDTLRNPAARVEMAEPVAPKLAAALPLPDDTEQLVKLNAGVQLGAGLLLSIGRLPRLAAAALAVSLVPTTLAGHRFWEMEDEGKRKQQQIHFLKNVGMLGGLVLATFDTEGAPSIGWRAKRRAGKVRDRAREALPVG